MNILIVDDSALMRGLCRRALQENDPSGEFHILEAADGEKALQHMAAGGVDCVFLDWNMPVLDGVSFVRQVRGGGDDTPIIMISAVTDPEKIMEATEAGVSDYIEKPIRPADIWERVKETLGRGEP